MTTFFIGPHQFFSITRNGGGNGPLLAEMRSEIQTRPAVTGAAIVQLGVGASEPFDLLCSRGTTGVAQGIALNLTYQGLVNTGEYGVIWYGVDYDTLARPEGGNGYRLLIESVRITKNIRTQTATHPLTSIHGTDGWLETQWRCRTVPLVA